MARCYSDDLRRKLLSAYDRGEGTLTQLAARFSVSVGWARKISWQRKRTGQAERVPHRPGCKLRAGEEVQQQVRAWFRSQPDLTLAEVQARLLNEAMDNLGSHKTPGVRQRIEQTGAQLLYLPPYSPDLNPVHRNNLQFNPHTLGSN